MFKALISSRVSISVRYAEGSKAAPRTDEPPCGLDATMVLFSGGFGDIRYPIDNSLKEFSKQN